MTDIGLVVAILVAALGSIGGFAALMKVNADNSKTISEGAVNIVEMMTDRINEHGARIEALEDYAERFDTWGDRLVEVVEKILPFAPDQVTAQEAVRVVATRPRRRLPKKPPETPLVANRETL